MLNFGFYFCFIFEILKLSTETFYGSVRRSFDLLSTK